MKSLLSFLFVFIVLVDCIGQSNGIIKKIKLTNSDLYSQQLGATSDSCLLVAGFDASGIGWGAVLSKIDKTGQTLWTKKYSHFEYEHITQLYQTQWGDYLIVTFSNMSNTYMGVLRLVDSSGNLKWKSQFTIVFSIDINACSFDDGTFIIAYKGYHPNVESPFLFKTDTAGNIKWRRFYSDSLNADISFKKIVKLNSNIYLGGLYKIGQVDKLFIAKSDSSGTIAWSKTINNIGTANGLWFNDFLVTPDSDIYIIGVDIKGLNIIRTNANGDILKSKVFSSYKKKFSVETIKKRSNYEEIIISGSYFDSLSNHRGYYLSRFDSSLNQISGFSFFSDSITSSTERHLELYEDDKLTFCANEYSGAYFQRATMLNLQTSDLVQNQLCNISLLNLIDSSTTLSTSSIYLFDYVEQTYPVYSLVTSSTAIDTLIDSSICTITGLNYLTLTENEVIKLYPNPSSNNLEIT